MSKLVDTVFSFLGRRSSKDQPSLTKRRRGKAVLKADSFVFLPGECTSNGTYLWGELITPRTVGVPPSSYSDDYSVLPGDKHCRRKNVRSVLVDSSGRLVGRRLSGSFVAKAVRNNQTLDEVEDGSLDAFLKEFEAEEEEEEKDQKYHTYDRADASSDRAASDEQDTVYDRLVHLPQRPASSSGPPLPPDEHLRVAHEEKRGSNLVLDLRDNASGARRRASSGGSAEHYPLSRAVVPRKEKQCAVDWVGLRDQLEMTAMRGRQHAAICCACSPPP